VFCVQTRFNLRYGPKPIPPKQRATTETKKAQKRWMAKRTLAGTKWKWRDMRRCSCFRFIAIVSPKEYCSLKNGKRAVKSTSWPAIRHLSACWPRKHSKNSRQQHWALHHPPRTLLFPISLQDPGNFTRFLMTIMTTIKYKSPWRNNMPRIYLSPAISLQPRTHTISFYGRGPKGKWRPWPWPMVIWKYGNYEAALYKAKNKKKILVGESELEWKIKSTSLFLITQ